MDEKIKDLLNQISVLEDELRTVLRNRETKLIYHIKGKRVEFDHALKKTHLKLKRRIFHWIVTDRPQNFITAPIIYSLIIPLLILDFFVTFFQATCFPIYGINKVKRADYIIFDRQYLSYLNFFERFHCEFCAYANGLIAYAGEIAARTEQYFCPIKHAHNVINRHARYKHFIPYGDAEAYHKRLETFRTDLAKAQDDNNIL